MNKFFDGVEAKELLDIFSSGDENAFRNFLKRLDAIRSMAHWAEAFLSG